MEEIYERFRDRAEFFVVYIREAHPTDGWQVPTNRTEGILYEQPGTDEGRETVAGACRIGLEISIPMLIDGIDNRVEQAYSAWPDRLYVVSTDGTIGYKGKPGPGGFKPREVERYLERTVADGR